MLSKCLLSHICLNRAYSDYLHLRLMCHSQPSFDNDKMRQIFFVSTQRLLHFILILDFSELLQSQTFHSFEFLDLLANPRK